MTVCVKEAAMHTCIIIISLSCGNSLGLMPKKTQEYIDEELYKWRTQVRPSLSRSLFLSLSLSHTHIHTQTRSRARAWSRVLICLHQGVEGHFNGKRPWSQTCLVCLCAYVDVRVCVGVCCVLCIARAKLTLFVRLRMS